MPTGLPIEQNATTTTSHPLTDHSKGKVHQESTASGWEETVQPKEQIITWDGCAPNGCHELTVHLEASETGWLSLVTSIARGQSNIPQSTNILKQEPVSMHSPSLVGIRTEIQASPQHSVAGPEEAPDTSSTFAKLNPAPASPQETPAQNPILQEIISKLGVHPPLPSSAPSPEPNPSSSPPTANSNTPPPLTTSPPLLTLGPTTLTLTPGLTSLLGLPPSATFIALATNDVGQTLLTVSASGTAVTATIEEVGSASTGEGTGVEASVTAAVRTGGKKGGERDGYGSGDEDVVMTRSKGWAGRREVGGWIWGVGWWVVMV